ncbi:TPA: hypothetical protein HA278_00555 [Candidatus Woesearchaeota archaeon]|jgi:hypothetical protein|nr:hypothetical protein [Candidatus Woesearchaeota archaeon]|tara:strand:+ start:421 stop:1245 length:825 start_codon:yes stop_codon:yes gene_type:complete
MSIDELLKTEDQKTFSELTKSIIETRVRSYLDDKKAEISEDLLQEAEEEPEAETELKQDSAEIALDPRLEKEIFIDSFDVAGKRVVLKSLGLGRTKPVVAYIDEKRWEIFSGPKIAKREARRHIKRGKLVKENIDGKFEGFMLEEDTKPSKSDLSKWIKKNKRKYDNGTEAAYAMSDMFDIEDELEKPNSWIWKQLRQTFGESFDFTTILQNTTKLNDGTKINLDKSMIERISLVYDMLEQSNKEKFTASLFIDKKNHKTIIEFVENQTKGISL